MTVLQFVKQNSRACYSRVLLLLMLLVCMSSHHAVSAGMGRVIESARIVEHEGLKAAELEFSFPLRYISHAPQESARELRIQLQAVRIPASDRGAAATRESAIPSGSRDVGIEEILYEGDIPGGPFLTFRFNTTQRYRVEPGSDFRSIRVVLLDSGTSTVADSAFAAGVPKRKDVAVKNIPDIATTLPKVPDQQIAELMEEARKSIAGGDYRRGVQLYTKVLQHPDHPYRQDALEFLGVARERNGQLAHATREYNRYLSLYPDGEGADRIRQRLAGITTMNNVAPAELSGGKTATDQDDAEPWDTYGSFAQSYRYDSNRIDGIGSRNTQSSLYNNLHATTRRKTSDYAMEARFNGSYLFDFLDDGPGDESTVSDLYFDVNAIQTGLSMRLGRQSRNRGGVLGRFDGLLLGYQANDWLRVDAVLGYPVFSSRYSLETERFLYGLSADLGTFDDVWDFNVFLIEQQVDGMVDRRALGGEARYFDQNKSLLAYLDYDIYYNSLNTFALLGTWNLPNRAVLSASFDHRNSPVIMSSNALQDQSVDDIDDLLDMYTEEEIRILAEGYTGAHTSGMLGVSYPLTDTLQLSGDLTLSKMENPEAFNELGYEVVEDLEYYLNIQLLGNDLFGTGDSNIFGVRYADTVTAQVYSLSANSRFNLDDKWRLNPRLRLDYRMNDRDDSTAWSLFPSLRAEYRVNKQLRLEFEAGGELTTRDYASGDEDYSSYFFNLGYRLDF